MPLLAIRRHQQTGKQIFPRRGPCAALAALLDLPEYGFRLVVGDQWLVSGALDQPIFAGFALDTCVVGAAVALVVDAPHGMTGIGQGLPFHADQRGDRPFDTQARSNARPRFPRSPGTQVLGYAVRVVADDELALEHRGAIANSPRVDIFKAVTARRTASRPESLPHIFRHAGEAFGLAVERMPLVYRLQDRAQQHFGRWFQVGNRLVYDAHSASCAFMFLENQRQGAAASYAGGIERENCLPFSGRITQRAEKSLKAGPVVILAGLHCISEFIDDSKTAHLREFMQCPALGIYAYITSILARPQIDNGLIVHCRSPIWKEGVRRAHAESASPVR